MLMTEDFLGKLWTLVKLRYLLIWAQARTRNGKIALLFLLYLLGASTAFVFAISGFGTAIAEEEYAQDGFLIRWALTALFTNGLGLPLLFGGSARAAFTDEALRRYPVDERQRFLVRQIIGALDPIWLILSVGVFSMVVGFSWVGKGYLLTGALGALFFIISNYLAAVIVLSIVGLMVRTRRGSAILGILVLGVISFGPLALSVVTTLKGRYVWDRFDQLLMATPPGAAATMMLGRSAAAVIISLMILIAWCIGLMLILKRLENAPPVSETVWSGSVIWNDFYDRATGVFGASYGPLVGKALRYNLRCNLIRFSLLTSPLLVVLGKYMIPGRSRDGELIITLALFFMTSSATGAAMMLNLFGFDDAGIRRYAVMPSTFATALRAANIASLALRAVTMLVAFGLWAIVSRSQVSWRIIVVVFIVVVSSLFLFNALGLWTSVFSSKRANFDSMWNNRLSIGANIVMVGGVVVPYIFAIVMSERLAPETIFHFWWILALLMLLSISFYIFSFVAVAPALNARRERLIDIIAGSGEK
jgi:hypothetical protein